MHKILGAYVMSALVLSLIAAAVVLGLILRDGSLSFQHKSTPVAMQAVGQAVGQATGTPASLATATIPPYTPLPSLTPSQTLLPPPTFEPPTLTPMPSATASLTPTPTVDLNISIPGLHGAETATPSTTPGCTPSKDWKLTYTVQMNDTLSSIAARYSSYATDIAQANCLSDANLIAVGQQLLVPGDVQPQAVVECPPWEVLTPFNGMTTVPQTGQITFNWRGPRGVRNLIRVFRPDGTKFERVVELRQNDTVDIAENFRWGGTYQWYVYPLDENFRQIACLEGGPWTFSKLETPPTPVPTLPLLPITE